MVIDGCTRSSKLTAEDVVPPGSTMILVCQVVGLPGTVQMDRVKWKGIMVERAAFIEVYGLLNY